MPLYMYKHTEMLHTSSTIVCVCMCVCEHLQVSISVGVELCVGEGDGKPTNQNGQHDYYNRQPPAGNNVCNQWFSPVSEAHKVYP